MRKSYFFLFCLLLLSSCGKRSGDKKQSKKLAVDYYKLSLLEQSPRRALQHINRALDQGLDSRYLAHKATLLLVLGAHAESKSCFSHALALASSPSVRADILNNYACLLADVGNKREALRLFVDLERDKDYLTPEVALVNQAKLYCDQGDWHRARGTLARATNLAPDYIDAFYYLGLVCYALEEYESASRSIERVLELEPGHQGAKELLGRID